jgi:hypothetical protein
MLYLPAPLETYALSASLDWLLGTSVQKTVNPIPHRSPLFPSYMRLDQGRSEEMFLMREKKALI